MNIVLIVLESLRKDCVNAYGQPPWGKVHTPHLDAFARESVMFTRAYPESLPTLPARRALYTGRRAYSFRKDDDRQAGDSVEDDTHHGIGVASTAFGSIIGFDHVPTCRADRHTIS